MAFDASQYDLSKNALSGGGSYGEGGVTDALQRLRALQGALKSGDIDYTTYNNLFQQFDPAALDRYRGIAAGGSKAATAATQAGGQDLINLSTQGGQDLNTFATQFKNLTGNDVTSADINNYFSNIAPQLNGNTSYADTNSMINQYLSNQYQPQIKAYQQGQQGDALTSGLKTVQDIVNQQNQSTVNNLTSPQVMEQFKEAYNGQGLLNSGAFSTGLAQTLAQGANQNQSAALQSFGLPAASSMYQTAQAPYQSFLQNLNPNLQTAGQNQNSLTDWYMNSDLQKQLASLQQPNSLTQWAPIISGALQGAGSAARAFA